MTSKTFRSGRFSQTSRSSTHQAASSTPAQRDPRPSAERYLGNQALQRLARSGALRAKLTVGPAGDRFEQEADHMADVVMRMPDPRIQRRCTACEEEEQREGSQLRAKPTPGRTPTVTPELEAATRTLEGRGRPLGTGERAFFEPRFGRDFGSVRVHDDARAATMARSVEARAFTLGRHVVFGAGEYSSGSRAGRHLMAHELTHVVQQSRPSHRPDLRRQPNFRDCTPTITGVADANLRLENGRQRAREYIGAARRALGAAPVAGTTYATALNRHFINPNAAQRATILANYGQIMLTMRVSNFICNSNNICGTEQAFWIPQDDLIHVCRPFWGLSRTCRAIVLVHEGAHDVGVDAAIAGHPPNRGSAAYPAGNVAPPVGQTTAARMQNPDAYAFFAAHIWRGSDTSRTCF